MATLDVLVTENSTKYRYELRGVDGATSGPLEQEHVVDVSQPFIVNLCERIDTVLAEALDGGIDHRARLAEYGKALYQHLLPSPLGNTPVLVSRLRESQGPLLVRSNETTVPWELLHDGREFLGLAHDIGRRSRVGRPVMQGRAIGRIERALVVGDTLGDLKAARREAEHVGSWLRERGVECTVRVGERANLVDVVMELGSGRYDLFHFCGHLATPHRAADAGLVMHGRDLLNERTLQGIEVGVPPVVFLSGCGADGRGADLCVSFMFKGAQAVVGARADIAEASARRFSEEFYLRLLDGESTGAAIRMARTSLTGESDAAWASFFLYGDPDAHITAGREPEVTAEPTPEPTPDALDADARALMDRVYDLAVGVATSMDLLIGLLETEELRAQIEDTVGAERLTLVTELLRSFNDGLPRRTTEGRATPSDTVADVLGRAEARATSDGRAAATTSDIAAAFVDIGGGSAARILELCGLSLEQLVPGPPGTGVRADGPRLFPAGAEDRLDRSLVVALRAALLLANARGEEFVSSYRLLRGFGIAESPVLRRSLERQGEIGARAFQQLAAVPEPRRGDFSKRAYQVLKQAQEAPAGPLAGEASILRALLADTGGSARRALVMLGVDVDRLLRDLEEGGVPAE